MPSSNDNKYKRNDESKAKTKKNKKKKNKVLKAFLLTILIMILIGIGLFVGVVISILNGAGGFSKSDFEISSLTTVVYDKDGNEYASLYSTENRMYASLSEISPYLPKAIIAIEDQRFKTHFGIDVKRTTAAVIKWLTTGNSDFGGSTITQQLIKKVTKDDDRSWQRKAREIVRAIQLEQWLSKDQIIELYMNIIYFGEGAYGVETAAYTYFNKSAKDLTVAECALIAGLIQSPEGRNPYRKPEAAKARQEIVLSKMYELGSISKEQYEEAKAQELVYQKGVLDQGSSNSYFVDAIVEDLVKELQEQRGVTKIMAQKMIYSNGLKIYSTVDPKIQSAMEEVYTNQNYFKLSNGQYDPDLQSAMVIIDYKTGNVVGLVGGAGEKTTQRGLNRATMSKRAPGSTIKPLAVYAPGIDTGKLTAATVFDDVPTTFKVSTTTWTPSNSYKGYRGLTPVRKGIEISSNVIAAKAFMKVGTTTSMEYLKKFGFTTLTNADAVPGALALGGLTQGMYPIEHAAAYGTLANSGIYLSPKLYTKVLDKNNETLIEKTSELREVVSPQTAYIMTSMLQDVITGISATGSAAALPNMTVAGKTGTTNSSKDRWFAGYTPYYVGSVWVGYDQQKVIRVSGNPAAKIWKAVMKKVHEGLANKKFTRPADIVEMEVCLDSGLLATDLCKQDRRGSRVKTELFNKEYVPTETCSTHVLATVCPESFKLANPTCLKTVGTTQIVCIDRHYTTKPSVLPNDYAYEVPSDYCEYHYAEKDEYGNYVEQLEPDNNSGNNGNTSEESDKSGDDKKNNEKRTFWWEN